MFPWMKGFGSEGAVVNIIFNIVLSAFIAWHYYFKPKKMKKQGVDRRKPDNPGKPCVEHGNKLTELNTEINNIKEDITEIKKNNREDHEKIFDKIDKVNRR